MYDQDGIKNLIHERRKNENIIMNYWCELMDYYLEKRKYFEGEIKSFADPRQDKLLPDMPYPSPKTLVLDLDEFLVYSEWTRQSGWKVFKRPGAEDFIRELHRYYEIVLYTDQVHTYVDPIMDRLDPERHIMHRIYKPDTQYIKGKHVRDLSKLNRDLSQVHLFFNYLLVAFLILVKKGINVVS